MTEQDYKAIWLALDDPSAERNYIAKERLDVVKGECDVMDALFAMQWNRMAKTTVAWREGHPERSFIQPDLGALLEWLMERAGIE